MATDDVEMLILDIGLTCPLCGHRILPAEIKSLTDDTVCCPGCHQVFSPE